MGRMKLLNVNVDNISEEEVYKKVLSLTEKEKPSMIILLDTYMLIKAKMNKDLLNIINFADLVIPISPGIKFGLNFLNKKCDKIYNFFNFTIRLFTRLSDEKKNIYVLGGNKNVSEISEKNIRDSFPGIRLMGKYHIDYKKDFESKLITAIQKVSPALVLVSMTRPKQEKWIFQKKSNFKNCVFIGVENFVNILGGKVVSTTEGKDNSTNYSISRIISHPLRIFLYIIYFFQLLAYKIFRWE